MQRDGGKPRSIEQIRRYFALIRQAHMHWPELHARQFTTSEDLRYWLQMKAGWRDIAAQLPLVGLQRERALLLVEAAVKAAGSHAMSVLHKDVLVIFRPRSISFAKMPHDEFCNLVYAVESVIEQESGLRVDDLMKHGDAP